MEMPAICATLAICVALVLSKAVRTDDGCPSVQQLVLGTTGVIHCSFQEGFFGVLWYDTTDVLHEDAIVTFREGDKSGTGYVAGEFDVYPNGSLVIYNVSQGHERNFTMLLLKTTSDLPVRYNINVLVNAQTFIPYPRINGCHDIREVCFHSWDQKRDISCFIQDARQVIPLTWMVKTRYGERNISSHLSVTNQTSFHTSTITISNPFIYSSFLTLFVCKADDSLGLLERNLSLVLISNYNLTPRSVNVSTKYVQINSKMRLKCSVNQFLFLIWQEKKPSQDKYTPIVYAVRTEGNFSHSYDSDYHLANDGSLTVHDVKVKHEGLYSCLSGDGMRDDVTIYDISVFIVPVPAYPVIEGCNHEQYCVLEVQTEGTLTCTLQGIYPGVRLDLRTLFHQSSEIMEFSDKQLTTNYNGDEFDVSLTSKYRIKDRAMNRLTIVCQVVGTDIDDLLLSTKFDVLFMIVPSTKETETTRSAGQNRWIKFVVIATAVLLIVLCGTIVICVYHKRRRENGPRVKLTRQDKQDIYKQTANDWEALPMLERKCSQDKQDVFITELKSKYQDLYDAVQPIPYIRDRLYCVDRVFVEGGIEYLAANDKIGGSGTWESLDTYQNIFNDPRIKSVRRILEGEPGYGKSTLTLQLAYDWCNKITASSLCNFEILILLRLRQLGGVTSIYKAIKQFLLPKDSKLTEKDIENIVCNTTSTVIILDGFDEYPDQDSQDSDVINIIVKKMFQQYDVILTTRSSYLPKDCPPQTKRVKLTGFDDNARDQYIRKAVVGSDENAAEKIKRKLKDNAVLSGLCQVPLFFVMFAHMSHESDKFQKFNSVTNFFRYMISCFHSHMKNKMKDENVQKYELLEKDHKQLDKIAFDGLSANDQKIVWKKQELYERLGQDFYNQYVRLGILIEEDVLAINDNPSSLDCNHIQYETEVRFYHKLFCEWYAAHYLADYVSKDDVTLDQHGGPLPKLYLYDDPLNYGDLLSSSKCLPHWGLKESIDGGYSFSPSNVNLTEDCDIKKEEHVLKNLDPLDLQYLYRFTCGINPVAGEKIIDYLKGSENGEKFAILCLLEQEGKVENLLQTIQQLCSKKVEISSEDNLLLQRSTIQLLEIASSNEMGMTDLKARFKIR